MRLYLARHGETIENKEKRILGSAPGRLTNTGHEQGQALAENIADLSIELVFASDLQRVIDTCEHFDENLLISYTPQLRERNFGIWEGKLRKEVQWQDLWESPKEPVLSSEISAEPLEAFTRRIAQFALALTSALGDTDKSMLAVSHIGVMNRFNFLSDPEAFEYIEYPNGEAVAFDPAVIAQNSLRYV